MNKRGRIRLDMIDSTDQWLDGNNSKLVVLPISASRLSVRHGRLVSKKLIYKRKLPASAGWRFSETTLALFRRTS